MRKLVALALAGLFGSFFAGSEASACHKKKCTPACAPAPVCAPVQVVCVPPPAPVCPPPAPVCAPAPVVCEAPKAKKCHFKMPKMNFGCHKKAACETVAYAPTYAPATYAAPQSYASPQASHQGY